MKIIRIPDMISGLEPLSKRLVTELSQHETVLWLVPGGSNITLAAAVMDAIPTELTPRLTLMLTDERFGAVDHPDSNVRQLREVGFAPGQATFIPVLHNDLSLEATVNRYAATVAETFSNNEVIIGQFGMGPDGHIAGILPGSQAVTSRELVAGYVTETFTRITLTPAAIGRIDVAYVFAFGNNKRPALENLANNELPLTEQPAQTVKQLKEAYVYNDQVGEAA